MDKIREQIPLMFCFDNNYALPASVAFYSLLEHANPDFEYKLYVLHSDISSENQNLLQETIRPFENTTLDFVDMENKFQDLFEKTNRKGHYSKEMFYKFCAPSIFPQYKKIIISDVDVVFLSDISISFFELKQDEPYYLAAHKGPILKGSYIQNFKEVYADNWSREDMNKFVFGAGYYVYNLENMRKDNVEQQFIDFALSNSHRIRQPEQDTINYICYNNIKQLPVNTVVCTYVFELYLKDEDFDNDLRYSKEELKNAFANPVQLHYVSAYKPWNTPSVTRSETWFKYLVKTPYLRPYLLTLGKSQNLDSKQPTKLKKMIVRVKDSFNYRVLKK